MIISEVVRDLLMGASGIGCFYLLAKFRDDQ